MRTEQEQKGEGGTELGPDVSLAAGASGMYDSFDDDLDFLNEADEKDDSSSAGGSRRDSDASAKGQDDAQKLSEEETEEEKEREREVAEAKEAKEVADTKAKRERESKARRTSVQLDDVSPQGAALLQAHNTPDFMLLPLELQGFCPWTMVRALLSTSVLFCTMGTNRTIILLLTRTTPDNCLSLSHALLCLPPCLSPRCTHLACSCPVSQRWA